MKCPKCGGEMEEGMLGKKTSRNGYNGEWQNY